jgi:two-component system, NtrC family, sensor kinase
MKFILLKLLAIFSVGCSITVHSQNNTIDSLKAALPRQNEDTAKVRTLNCLARMLIDSVTDNNSALKYAKDALLLSEAKKFKRGKGEAYITIGRIYYKQNNYPLGLQNFLSAKQEMEEAGERIGIALSHDWIGYSYITIGNNSEALKNFHAALRIYKELKDKRRAARMYQLIAGVHFFEGEEEEAVRINLIGLELMKEIGDQKGVAQSYLNNGEIYLETNQHEKSIEQYLKAVETYAGMKINDEKQYSITYTRARIGKVYEKQGDLAAQAGDNIQAKKKFLQARMNYLNFLPFADESEDKETKIVAYQALGLINIKLGNHATARHYLEKGLALSKEIENYPDLRDSYNGLAQLDSASGNFQQAYEHHKLYVSFRDSVDNEESRTNFLKTKMQNDFLESQNTAKLAQAKKDAETKKIRDIQYAVIVAFLLLAMFLFWNNKQKQKAKAKVEQAYSELKSTQTQLIQSEKMASLGELTAGIAHEIQNPLNFVNNFSEVNKELLVELKDEAARGNIAEVNTIADDLINNQDKISHHGKRADAIVKGMLQHSRATTGKKEPTDINPLADEYLKLAYHGLRAKDPSFHVTTNTDFDKTISSINIIPQDIGRVILNLITNAFYAVTEKKKQIGEGYEPTVSASTRKVNDHVQITVADNGNGIPQKVLDKIFQPFFTTKPTGQGTGLGLSLSYDIVKAHGGEIKVSTKEGEGSKFIIQLPIN